MDTWTFLTDSWKYSVSTQTLFDKLTQQSYHVSWTELRAIVTIVNEFKKMLATTLIQIATLERSKINFDYPAEGPIPYVGTVNSHGPTLQDLETLVKSRQDPSMAVSFENSAGMHEERVSTTPLNDSMLQSFEPYEFIPLTSTSPNMCPKNCSVN